MTEKWDRRFLELARHVASWSKDPSTKVGAVVAQGKNVVGLGYNGFPMGVSDDEDRYTDRDVKLALVVHSEVNALIMAGEKALGGTLYVYPSFSIPCTCSDCAKTVIQFGISEVVGYLPRPEDAERAKRWQRSIDIARMMYEEAGVSYRWIAP